MGHVRQSICCADVRAWYGLVAQIMRHSAVTVAMTFAAAGQAQVYAPFAQRYATTVPGDLVMLANTVVTCQSPSGNPATCGSLNDSQIMRNTKLPADASDTAIFNSSSSDLTATHLPVGAQVVEAELYWGGVVASSAAGAPTPDPNLAEVKFAVPGGTYLDLSPQSCVLSPQINTFGSGNHFLYLCRANVTLGMQSGGLGTYRVGNVPVQTGVTNRFGGWAITLVVRKPGGVLRNFTINDGMAVIRNVTGATSVSVPISGFTTPLTGPVMAQVGMVAYDGDKGSADAFRFQGQGSLQVALSDACNPAADEFNSSICALGSTVTTRSTVNNNLSNTLGFDADIIQLTNPANANLGNGVTSATITATTSSEGYFLGVVTTAIDVYQPAFEAANAKTVVNLTHPGLPANIAYPGDVLRYEITANNIGQDNATNVTLSDVIPPNTSYQAGTLEISTGTNVGMKTDAAGDDQAEFAAAPERVVFRLGAGATATNGGVVRCPTCVGTQPTSTTVRFNVKVNDAAPADTVISNVADIRFRGVTSNQDYAAQTNQVQVVVVKPSIGVAKQTGALVDNGDGTYTVPLTFTVKNLGGGLVGTATMLNTVQVVDDLNAAFAAPATYTVGAVSATGTLAANAGFNGNTDPNLLNAAASTLPADATETITFNVTFNPHGSIGPFNNQAAASGNDTLGAVVGDVSNNGIDPDPNGNGDPNEPGESVPTPIPLPAADLSLAKGVDNPAPLVGDQVVYTLTVSNVGPNSAGGITVADTLPSGLVYLSDNGGGSYDAASGIWTVGSLAVGGSSSLVIIGTVAASGDYLNIAEIMTSNVPDPDSIPGNGVATEDDYASVAIAPQPVANVSIQKIGPASVDSGGNLTYTLAIANAGPSAADGAGYNDVVPANVTSIAASCGSAAGGAVCAAPNVAGNTVSGVVPTLPVGGSVLITITGTAPQGATALSNTATATPPAGTTDPDTGNNSSTVGTQVAPAADIAVSKSVDNATPNVTENVTFTVVAYNNGPDDASGVVITDALPSGLVFVSATPSQGTYDDATGAWSVGVLANGAEATLEFVATVNQPGALTNTATRTTGDQADPDSSNNSGSATVNGQPSADLQIRKNVDNATPNVGTNVTYTIVVTNAGPDDATGVAIDDLLPTGLTFVSATPSQGAYDNVSGIWTLGDIASNGTATLDIMVSVVDAGPITNTATVGASDQFDPNTSNNSGGVTINGQSADLQVVKTVDNANPLLGDTIAFTITVTNNGPSDATGVDITDVLPAGLTFVSATPSQGTYDDAGGVWTLGDLTASGATATATLIITATVDVDTGFVNIAAVSAVDQADPVPSNNSSSVAISPIASADVSIVKTGPAAIESGGAISYSLLISNAGPSAADGASYSDVVPVGISGITATCAVISGGAACAAPAIAGNTVSGSVPTLPAAASVAITISGTAPVGATTLSNTATVLPPTGIDDPDDSNNTSAVTTEVAAAADIAVAKSVDNAAPQVGAVVTFTITAHNSGPDAATNIVITDPLPAGLSFVSATPSQGTYDAASGIWNINALANGATANLLIAATVTVDTAIVNTATYGGGDVADPNPDNDSASAAIGPVAAADLSIVKTGPATVTPGATLNYTISVTNDGPSDATNVVVNDPVPAGLVFVGNAGACSSAYPCTLPTLATGDSATITSTYVVPADYAGANPIVNMARIGADTPDPDDTNNSSSVQTAVTAVPPLAADLRITKSGPADTTPGTTIDYTLIVTNAGPDAVADAVLVDPTPAGLQFVAAGVPCAGGFPCALGPLAAGASLTITASYAIPPNYAADAIVNTAQVASPTIADPTPGNNASVATTIVQGGEPNAPALPVPLDVRWMMILMGVLLTLAGAAGVRRKRG